MRVHVLSYLWRLGGELDQRDELRVLSLLGEVGVGHPEPEGLGQEGQLVPRVEDLAGPDAARGIHPDAVVVVLRIGGGRDAIMKPS